MTPGQRRTLDLIEQGRRPRWTYATRIRVEPGPASLPAPDAPQLEWQTRAARFAVILVHLVNTIDATGGVVRTPTAGFVPAVDEEWIDLGDVYQEACVALDIPMVRARR
jgi:hypothetical protein